MPRLPTYTAKLEDGGVSGGRRATAEDAGAVDLSGAVRAVQSAAEGFVDREEQDNIRHVIVENQKLRAKAIADLRAAEMEGRSTAPVLEALDNDLARISEGVQTKRGFEAAEQYGSQSRSAIAEAAHVMEVRRAGQQLTVQMKDFDAAAAEEMQTNPTALDAIAVRREALLGTFAGRVTPELIDAARTEGKAVLAASSARSVIEADPALAERLLRGKHEPWGALTPEQRASLIDTAQAAARANESTARAKEQERRMEMQKVGDAEMSNMLGLQADGRLSKYDTKALLRRVDIDPDRRLQILNVYNALSKSPKTDAVTANNAYRDIFRSEGDPARLRNEAQIDALVVAGKVDERAHRGLRAAFASREKPEAKLEAHFLSRAESMISPRDALGRFLTPDGPMKAYQFRRDVEALRDKMAADPKQDDPSTLFDTRHKNYQQHVAPLLQLYMPKTVFTPNEKGGLTESRSPMLTDLLPVIKSKEDLDVFPGGMYRWHTDAPGVYRKKAQTTIKQIGGAPALDIDAIVQGVK